MSGAETRSTFQNGSQAPSGSSDKILLDAKVMARLEEIYQTGIPFSSLSLYIHYGGLV